MIPALVGLRVGAWVGGWMGGWGDTQSAGAQISAPPLTSE